MYPEIFLLVIESRMKAEFILCNYDLIMRCLDRAGEVNAADYFEFRTDVILYAPDLFFNMERLW